MRLSYLLAALVALAAPAAAQTCTTSWAAPVSGSWNTAANWTNGIPAATATACIQLAGTYTVTLGVDQALAGLVLGGASGTQTLALGQTLTSLGGGTVGPNGRLDVLNSANCGSCDGLPLVLGTLTVEGTITHVSSTGLISQGGTLDIAPGGQLLANTSGGSSIGGSGVASTLRVRGRVVFDPNGGPANDATLRTLLDIDGGTVDVRAGQVNVNSGGRLRNASFAVAAGAEVRVSNGAGGNGGGIFVVEGTLSGDPQGTLQFVNGALQAGVGGATLAVGGTGLLAYNPSSLNFEMRSAGGAFLNTGLLRVRPNGLRLRQVVLENEGTIRVEGSSITLFEGAVVRNRAGGVVDLVDGGSFGDGDRTGRLENAGLLSTRLVPPATSGRSALNDRLRSLPGSELRIGAATRLSLDLPASASFPAGTRVTGTGELSIASTEFLIEGELSPGTEAQPIGTLTSLGRLYFSRVAGSPRLVVDVDAGGQSDRIVALGGAGPNFPVRPFGALVVRVRPGYTPQVGDTWTILTGSSQNQIQGTFSQVVAQDAPAGIAFVAEVDNTGTSSITLRAVAVAPGGTITVSDTAPVGGGLRTFFLSGPGVPGIASARLDCTDCLDAAALGSIPATLVGAGTLREARFDLENPRAFGLYDLVLVQPGLPDARTPVTVRPYISLVRPAVASQAGLRVWPRDVGTRRLNTSAYTLFNRTNGPGAFPFVQIERPVPARTSLTVSSSRGAATYDSDVAPDPLERPLLVSVVPPNGEAIARLGMRIDPEAVLFPEQSPAGPDDPRLPFGEGLLLSVFTTSNTTLDRAALAAERGLRATPALAAYLASVDAADAAAVRNAVAFAVGLGQRTLTGSGDLLSLTLDDLNRVVPTPPGLATSAALAFKQALGESVQAMVTREETTYDDAFAASDAVRDVYVGELAALGIVIGRPGGAARPAGGGGQWNRDVPIPPSPDIPGLGCFSASVEAIEDIGRGDAGGAPCPPPPPAGPVDPNDKTAATDLLCETGTVTVDGREVTRCVRYFIPSSRTAEPIQYTVRFENLAAATGNAEFVTITDVLDANLDASTLEVVATSSDSTFAVSRSGQTVSFVFSGIDLPPNVNQPEGEGFVTFTVRPRAGLAEGAEIRNNADIVFDFNPAIRTPDVVHEVRAVADMAVGIDVPDRAEAGQPVPVRVTVVNLRGDDAADAAVVISTGTAIASATPSSGTCAGTGPVTCTFGALASGEVQTVDLALTGLPIGETTLSAAASTSVFDGFAANDRDLASLSVTPVAGEETPDGLPTELTLAAPRPNPARAATTLRWGLPAAAAVDVRVFDLLGREVARVVEGEQAAAGWHETRLDASRLASGVYVVRLVSGDVVRTRRIVVVR